MPKNKRPVPRKSPASPEQQEEALTQALAQLAAELAAHQEGGLHTPALREKAGEFQKSIRKCLHQKKDDVLYEALERVRYSDPDAYRFLKERIEETAEVIVFQREQGPALEVNAFVIPLFAHTSGGLDGAQCFQDQEAFDLLSKSFQAAQLESPDASVVLVSHAYHLDEIDGITYSQVNDMVREAFAAMTRKKAAAAPSIENSMRGWPESEFAPDDPAVELRFLLGFALKRLDDRFYQVPDDEAEADRYFATRETRFQAWTQQVAPLVQRCLATDGRDIELHFLYQDLFHGGKERGMGEYYMLEMMSELHHGLHLHGAMPEHAHAIIGPAAVGDEMVLRVNLHAETDGALLASAEKPLSILADLQGETADACDALQTIGVKSLALAAKFDAEGQAIDVHPYEA